MSPALPDRPPAAPRALLGPALLGLLAAGCGPADGAAPGATRDGRPVVVTTTGMVADLVRHVGGDAIEVRGLMGPGVDPHLYKPSGGDVREIKGADLVFYSGLKLEEGLFKALDALAARGRPIVPVTRDLPPERLLSPPEFVGHPDPHVWHDAALWAECLDVVEGALSEQFPDDADIFAANAAAYRAELLALDDYVRTAIGSIPKRRRVLVTAHDAFGYFGRTYDIEVKSVQGVTTQSEAGVADVNALAKFLAESGVSAVFAETSVSDRAVRAVVEGTNRRGGDVRISSEKLYSDALGAPDGDAADYVGMLVANVHAIVGALGGTVPPDGFVPPAEPSAP